MKLNYKLFSICVLSFFVIFLSANFVLAEWGQPGSWGQPGGGNSISNFINSSNFITLANRIAGWIFTLAIPIAVIMIVWSGIMFMAAGGQEDKINTAKRALTWAIVGLAIAFIGIGFTSLIQDILGTSPQNITASSLVNSLNRVANLMFYLGPAFAIIFLTWAGITYMTAGGDEKKIGEAKKRFWWGVIGAAVVIGAGTIIRTVMANLPVIRF